MSLESLREFVRNLAARPGMWVGLPASVSKFAAAIAGYEAALWDAGVPDGEPMFSSQFSEWLRVKWRVSPIVGWDTHIKERVGDDEAGIAEAARLIELWFRARDERSAV